MAESGRELEDRRAEAIRRDLIAWYDRGHRDLPWRRDGDPYRILVSETMLVQTTVAAVVPFFARFLERFPTVEALARADEADVLKAWEGLGYYRRARQLHSAAKAIVNDHRGRVPDDPEALRSLPGVGRYIAGAVLSFAFDRPAPIVEANTQRVLARLLAIEDDIARSSSQKTLWDAAERLVSGPRPGDFNQAIMELGATVCTPKEPMCLICPVASACRGRALGIQDRIPAKAARASPLEVVEACALVAREGRWLVVRRGAGRLWEGFWEFPTVHVSGADPAGRSPGEAEGLAQGVRRLTGVVAEVASAVKTLRFGVTRHRVELTAHLAADRGGDPIPSPGFTAARFASPEDIAGFSMGSAVRKLANLVIEPV